MPRNIVSLDEFIAQKRRQEASKKATEIMGKKRTPTSQAAAGGSLKSRITSPASGSGVTSGGSGGNNINRKWTHDLHHKNNPNANRISKKPTQPAVRNVSAAVAKSLQNNRLFAALHSNQVQVTSAPAAPSRPRRGHSAEAGGGGGGNAANGGGAAGVRGGAPSGFSIKGSAGPAVVQASNFAPGTTAEDIKHAMEPLGKILSCIILTAMPTVISEIVFQKKEAAEKCIAQYNGQRADGKLLHVLIKNWPPVARINMAQTFDTTMGDVERDPYLEREEADRRRREQNISFQDGKYGVKAPPMYSDALMKKGRGFNPY